MRRALLCELVLMLALGAPLLAMPRSEEAPATGRTSRKGVQDQDSPRILGHLRAPETWWLRAAFARARAHASRPECRALFQEHGAEPLEVLAVAVYSAPRFRSEEETCRQRQAAAFTSVGPARTVICPAFSGQLLTDAAATLLHEALHNAGQTEWPVDPRAPTSREIQSRVKERCGL